MKSFHVILLFGVVIVAGDVRAEYRETVLADKPVAWRAFDESSGAIAADQVGDVKGDYVGVASRRGVRAANIAVQAAGRIQMMFDEQQDARIERVLNGVQIGRVSPSAGAVRHSMVLSQVCAHDEPPESPTEIAKRRR